MRLVTLATLVAAFATLVVSIDLIRAARTVDPRGIPKFRIAFLALVTFLLGVAVSQYYSDTSRRQIIDRFHRLYYNDRNTWRTSHWLGVLTGQNANDAWIHQEIISELKPDFIVETGTFRGGSAVLWATILAQVNPAGRVITIDIDDQVAETRATVPIFREKVEFLHGSSTDPKIVGEVERRVRGKNVLVILDSNHQKAHVAAELRSYSPLVPVGGYIIVQDTNVNGHPVNPQYGPGPMEAVNEFLAGNDRFVADTTREKLLFTMHPRGYLKRQK